MKWKSFDQRIWDIEDVIPLSDASLARVFRAIIRCDGRVHRTFCMEKEIGRSILKHANRYCGVQLMVSLPLGSEIEFEKLSQCKLIEPKKLAIN